MDKPVPHPNSDTRSFWEGCHAGVLRYQCCGNCGPVPLIPRAVCSHCHTLALEWKDASGHGTILSYTNVYRAPTQAFRADVPYVIAIIDMDEGFRLMVNVRGGPGPHVQIGAAVRVDFEQRGEVTVPIAVLEAQ